MENIADNKRLTYLQKIILFTVVSMVVGLPQFIIKIMIVNTGFGSIGIIRLYLWILPSLVCIMHMNFRRRSFKLPHLVPFLLMISVFGLFEKFLSVNHNVDPHSYALFWRQTYIYVFFLILVNFGLNRTTFYKVIDFAFYSGLAICLLTYVGYLGFFKVSIYDYSIALLPFEYKPQHLMHVNIVSYIFAFTILFLIIKQLNERAFSPAYLFRDLTVILLLFVMITMNAARGAFVIAAMFIFYYIYFLWRNKVRGLTAKVFIACLILVSILVWFRVMNALENFELSESKILIVRRFQQDFTKERLLDDPIFRIINMENAWRNFLDYPFTGVGYYGAAKRYDTGTRSNNQYLQLLASSGIIFFAIYIYYNFRLLVFRFKVLKRPEVALSLISYAIFLLLRLPINMAAIFGYIAIHFYYESTKNNN